MAAIVWVIASPTGNAGPAGAGPHTTRRNDVWLPALGGVLILWSLLSGIGALRAALLRPPDQMGTQDAEFRAFIPYLPPSGTIGFLQPFDGWNDASVRTHYAAQYSLAPRVVIESRLSEDMIIVARDAARPEGETRLSGFVEVARVAGGHRLFRRFP